MFALTSKLSRVPEINGKSHLSSFISLRSSASQAPLPYAMRFSSKPNPNIASTYKIPLSGKAPTKERQEAAVKELLHHQQQAPKTEHTKSKKPAEEEEEEDQAYVNPVTGEVNGPKGLEPTRYGDWAFKGRMTDF